VCSSIRGCPSVAAHACSKHVTGTMQAAPWPWHQLLLRAAAQSTASRQGRACTATQRLPRRPAHSPAPAWHREGSSCSFLARGSTRGSALSLHTTSPLRAACFHGSMLPISRHAGRLSEAGRTFGRRRRKRSIWGLSIVIVTSIALQAQENTATQGLHVYNVLDTVAACSRAIIHRRPCCCVRCRCAF
jgi:hypothetical protein